MAPISYQGKFSALSLRLVVSIPTVHLRDFEGGLRPAPPEAIELSGGDVSAWHLASFRCAAIECRLLGQQRTSGCAGAGLLGSE